MKELSGGRPHRAGICLVSFTGPTYEALRYLITHCNELQRSLEFELIWSDAADPLIAKLGQHAPVAPQGELEELLDGFSARQETFQASYAGRFGLQATSADNYVVVSLSRLTNNFYVWGKGKTAVIALGGWDRSFAPPSLVEYAQTIILRLAASAAVPSLRNQRHLGTMGCLLDFNASLDTLRLKVLNSFICDQCRRTISNEANDQLYKDLLLLLGKTWLGKADDPLAPAAICRKLGYDLFLTKGIQPSLLQTLSSKLQGDLVSEMLKLITAVILAYLLFRLGLSAGGKD